MTGSGSGEPSSSSAPAQRSSGLKRLAPPPIKTSSSSSPSPPAAAATPEHHTGGDDDDDDNNDITPLLSRPRLPAPPPLLLTVRFSTSRPDLLLDIPRPHRTTVAALKHLIRSRLDQPDSQRRLRFIHSGRILADAAVLGAVLKPVPPPPPSSSSSLTPSRDHHHHHQHRGASSSDPKGKGKAVDGPYAAGAAAAAVAAQRVYVICSIGDLLTDAELDEERRRAEEPAPEEPTAPGGGAAAAAGATASASPAPGRDGGGYVGGGGDGVGAAGSGPRGFDRLLAAGFTPAEVNQLRLQFRSIQEARHTADTMPSPDALRTMEDAWMDSNNAGGGGGLAAAVGAGGLSADGADGGGADAVGEEFGLAGVLDLLLRGMFIGFVWPLGAVGWLVRDEEKIPKRMRVFVYFGFVLSLLIGTIRAIG